MHLMRCPIVGCSSFNLVSQAEHQDPPQIIKLPLDMGCVSDQSVERLAELFDATGLEAIKDKKDKIISRLYLKKTAQMMSQVPL